MTQLLDGEQTGLSNTSRSQPHFFDVHRETFPHYDTISGIAMLHAHGTQSRGKQRDCGASTTNFIAASR